MGKPVQSTAICAWIVLSLTASGSPQSDLVQEDFFEREIRPLLVQQCIECHNTDESSGGLNLSSRASLLNGGDSGPAVVPGNAPASLLIKAVKRSEDLAMPPEGHVSERGIDALIRWVNQGAVWPETAQRLRTPTMAAAHHWAFQPVVKPPVPAVSGEWGKNPVDAFVMQKLLSTGLHPSPEAPAAVLRRRLSYTLTGLPPSATDVELVADPADAAGWSALVDHLLDSPQYGQHWARHWLDVARYADTKGYVYGREERFWVHAWRYRDWVVDALNNDVPYDRFLKLQLAADLMPDRSQDDLAAMGFLTMGRRFLGVRQDIIDDRIDVVCRGTMALTVSCARCHDHKFDPVPTADYYALYGVFDSCSEHLVRLDAAVTTDDAYEKELQSRQQKLSDRMQAARSESTKRARQRIRDYLHAQTELHRYPPDGFDQIFAKSDLLPAFVRQWEAYLHRTELNGDPIFAAWHLYREIPAESFAAQTTAVTHRLHAEPQRHHPRLLEAFAKPPASFQEVIDRYASVFQAVDADWQKQIDTSTDATSVQHPDSSTEQLRLVLYGADSPCHVPDEPVVQSERFFDSATLTELWKLQGEIDRWIIQSKHQSAYALALMDRRTATEPQIFVRGNPLRKGDFVPRRFLTVFSKGVDDRFQHGSGRRELAEAIVDPGNPLTARVIVNRVWTHHFGQGLVTTASDFGLRADPPSHPQLLDWLTARFVAEGWSLKKLHRWILNSATFRQSSAGPTDDAQRIRYEKADPENRLLWRMNPRRLSFEQFRDSLLTASGELDLTAGGKPVDLFSLPSPLRRTIYGLVDRQFLPSVLRVFDFANPDLHVARRPETTVPQQALFFMNHPLVLGRVKALSQSVPEDVWPVERVQILFQRILQRSPSDSELRESLEFVDTSADVAASSPPATAADWSYGYGRYEESRQTILQFQALPYFNGNAWQGGSKWPDAKLGWTQVTSTGGHPGNTREHACIRRWTASHAMTISLQSKLIHEPAAGDGIRAFVVSSRAGLLHSAVIHADSVELNRKAIAVEAGETIDFVVDINDVLNSDQFLWSIMVTRQDATESTDPGELVWNSETDFPQNTTHRLTPWEQLAQVLMCSNEFLFVD